MLNIPSELNIHHACLTALEHDIFELLHVPVEAGEYGEYVGEDADLIEVSDSHFAEFVPVGLPIHAVRVVDGALSRVLLDNTHGLLTDGRLTLLGRGADMVATVDSRVLC